MTSHILTPSKLRGINYKWYTTVPLFDGELDYLKGAHLWYAVPAFLCMIFILIPPPTILILEPILTKVICSAWTASQAHHQSGTTTDYLVQMNSDAISRLFPGLLQI